MNDIDNYDMIEIPIGIGCSDKYAIHHVNNLLVELRTLNELYEVDKIALSNIPLYRLSMIISTVMKLKRKRRMLVKLLNIYVKIRFFMFKCVLNEEDKLNKMSEM